MMFATSPATSQNGVLKTQSDMTREDAIKYLRQIYPNGGHCWLDEQRIEALDMAIQALSVSLPEGLDEAAKQFVGYDMDTDELRDYEIGVSSFKAGADWMAGQGITTEDYAHTFCNGELRMSATIQDNNPLGIRTGDKVIVQIRKK